MFIKFTDVDDLPVLINSDHIQSFNVILYGKYKGLTFIIPNANTEALRDGGYIVKESIESIAERLGGLLL